MAKISVQQRKYFVERIETSINEKINELKQANAAQVQALSDEAYEEYLKLLKVNKDMAKFEILDREWRELASKLSTVYADVRQSLGFNSYEANVPSVYSSSNYSDMRNGYRWLCGRTAAKNQHETPEGKVIKALEDKKRAAIDELHGVNELEGLKSTVNAILKGADVPLLGA